VAYKTTFLDIQKSQPIRVASSYGPETETFRDQVNEAQRRLLRRGSWFGTEVLVEFRVHDRCITWPREVGTIEGVAMGRNSDGTNVQNNWYSILHRGRDHFHGGHEQGILQDIGFGTTYRDITGCPGSYIYAFATKREDWGKKITIFGTDTKLQPLQQKVGGFWQPGVTLTLGGTIQGQYVSTPMLVVNPILSVIKEVTQGNVILYSYDPTTQTMFDIANYQPGETNPQYRKSKLGERCFFNNVSTPTSGVTNPSPRHHKITALVKLAFVPVLSPYDFMLIDNIDALKLMIQSIRFEEDGDLANKDKCEAEAIRELNLELRTQFPQQSTVVVSDVVGGRMIHNPW
jgi:hypothetical protein